jgi:hypothetical protein
MASQNYYIKSQLNNLVLGADGDNPLRSTPVYANAKTGHTAQQWRDDPATGTIRNMLNFYCVDIERGILVLKPYKPGKESQQWERKGDVIASRVYPNIVWDIECAIKAERSKIHTWGNGRTTHQLWTYEAV